MKWGKFDKVDNVLSPTYLDNCMGENENMEGVMIEC